MITKDFPSNVRQLTKDSVTASHVLVDKRGRNTLHAVHRSAPLWPVLYLYCLLYVDIAPYIAPFFNTFKRDTAHPGT